MVQETLEYIPTHAQLIVDGTLGHGGHTAQIAQHFPHANIIGIDRDEKMLATAKKRLQSYDNVQCIHGSYADIVSILAGQKADFIILDLGVNMEHYKDPVRGFSVTHDGPLDMRFDTANHEQTAAIIINTRPPHDIAAIFVKYADFTESEAGKLAKHIAAYRKKEKITTTKQLINVLKDFGIGHKTAAVLFQALRIAVNGELHALENFLDVFGQTLTINGRCAIMTYHSIEDRMVKQAFKTMADTEQRTLINKKVIKPHRQEIQHNKAARSAKYRIIEKTV